jgi:hypothetical protein
MKDLDLNDLDKTIEKLEKILNILKDIKKIKKEINDLPDNDFPVRSPQPTPMPWFPEQPSTNNPPWAPPKWTIYC